MNDVRIGVTTAYIRDEAGRFIDEFRKFLSERERTTEVSAQEKEWKEKSTLPHPESNRWQLAHQITSNVPNSHSVFITNDKGDVPLLGYGSDYYNALNHLEIKLQDPECPFVIVKK